MVADFSCFDTLEALELNRARMEHLFGLGLPLEGKSVLEVGAGVGHLANYWIARGNRIVSTDARDENCREYLRRLGLGAWNIAVEELSDIDFGFDIVFCYGLLYHLENPLGALRVMAEKSRELLLIETIVRRDDTVYPALYVGSEDRETCNQGLSEFAAIPNWAFVPSTLRALGLRVFVPRSMPDHPDFKGLEMPNTTLPGCLRRVFIGVRKNLPTPGIDSMISTIAEL